MTEYPADGEFEVPMQGDAEAIDPSARHQSPRRRRGKYRRRDDCWRSTHCDPSIGAGGPCYGRPACDLPQHYPYVTDPKFYYYFRPYNWFHIEPQQNEVENYGLDRRNPYDNRFLQEAYERVEAAHPLIGPAAESIEGFVEPPHILPAPEEQPTFDPPVPGPDVDEPAGPEPRFKAPDESPAAPRTLPRRSRSSARDRLPLLPTRQPSRGIKFREPSLPQDAPTDDSDTVQSGLPGGTRLLRFLADANPGK